MTRSPPSKLLVMCGEEHLDECYTLLKEHFTEDVAHIIRGCPPWFVEVLSPNVNKGSGFSMLCDRLNCKIEDAVAFGDGDNDLEFIERSGTGIAMKNAKENVKNAADAVTEHSNDEDGVIRHMTSMNVC
jgi:hydroxymethylpyrimidine pyrophosphatase-like HAD family hydrolase